MNENTKLAEIGISPRKIKQFADKEIITVKDLLMFRPRKYLDFRKPINLRESQKYAGQRVAVKGTIISVGLIRMQHCEVVISDGSNFCSILWFNQAYKASQFTTGSVLAAGGVMTWNEQYHKASICSPDFATTDIDGAFTIVPVYSKIKGMSEDYLKGSIELALQHIGSCVKETLTEEQRKKLNVIPLTKAVRFAHRPQNDEEIEQAQRRFTVDFLYPFCLGLEEKAAEAGKSTLFQLPKGKAEEVMRRAGKALPFELTDGQVAALNRILAKMESGNRVDCLVQGDVGCGKTVVAEIAALAMASCGYQVAIMAPTQVLASQHYSDFGNFMSLFGIDTVYMCGGMKAKEEAKVLKAIKDGKAKVIVGTHAVVSSKVEYANLGLVIVDEEHRFGVKQREALREKAKEGVHSINMSATPIPRTLATTLYGTGTEIINIKTMPQGRKPVRTIVWSNFNTCMRSVYNQIQEGHQCYIVCPSIEETDAEDMASVKKAEEDVKAWFQANHLDTSRIKTISGDMSSTEIQKNIEEFSNGKADILISTTIVEVGVNVPNATVIVIENAERFGLAQLHQLRGRVGRGGSQGYCVLLSNDKQNERLQTLASTNDGFVIAESDLRMRGTGQLLGVKQSGKDLYMEVIIKNPDIYKDVRELAKEEVRKCTADA